MFLVGNQSHTALAQPYTGPAFKPFYGIDMIDATLTQWDDHTGKTFLRGELTDVNNARRACGWVEYDESGNTYTAPIYYTVYPRLVTDESYKILYTIIGRSLLLPTDSYDYATAEGMSESQAYDVTYMAGAMGTDSSACDAVVWTCRDQADTYTYEFITGLRSPSIAYAIYAPSNNVVYVVGQHDSAAGQFSTSFVARGDWDTGEKHWVWQIEEPHPLNEGFASDVIEYAANDIRIVGQVLTNQGATWEAYQCAWDGTPAPIHPVGNDWCGARAVNDSLNIVGWRWPNGALHRPVYWEYVSGEWTPYDIVGPPAILDAIAQDVNESNEVVASFTPDTTNGGKLWKLGTAWDIDDLTYLNDAAPDVSASVHKLWAINDDLWMAGSYRAAGGNPRPMLLVPYDVDNNGKPDFREIADGSRTDSGGRQWLLDDAEIMRAGIYSAGWNGGPDPSQDCKGTVTGMVNNVQIVRNILLHTGGTQAVGLKEFATGDDSGVSKCGDLADMIDEWTDGYFTDGGLPCIDGGTHQDKEYVVTVRTVDKDDSDLDYIPTEQDIYPRSYILYHLRELGFRMANCIDFVQLGNEHWSGAGRIYIHANQLHGEGCNGASYLSALDTACQDEALALIHDWYMDQAREVRIGSALRGRPLRLITSALPGETVVDANSGSADAFVVDWVQLIVDDLANTHEMSVDQHLHYKRYDDVGGGIDALLSPEYARWDTPASYIALEWGPWLNNGIGWWFGGGDVEFGRYFTVGAPQPAKSWDEFVRDWEQEQFPTYGFQFYDVLSTIEASGFLAACYGQASQFVSADPSSMHWNLASLTTLGLRDDCTTCKAAGDDPYFSTLVSVGDEYHAYVSAAGLFYITGFDPHPDGCECAAVCAGGCATGN